MPLVNSQGPVDFGPAGAVQPPPLPGELIRLDDPRTGPVVVYGEIPSAVRLATPMLLVHSVNAAASAYEMRPLYQHYKRYRPSYALDLPGFGLSDRSSRRYTPRLFTDAVLVATEEVRRRHDGVPIDVVGLSLGCEFVARAAYEEREAYRSLALVSPTGMSGQRRREGPAGSVVGSEFVHTVLAARLWRRLLFGLLTRPKVVRYFLRRTFGRREIDPGLWGYAVRTTKEPGAEHAPLYFLSALLFSADITTIYEGLSMPVWMSHGVRGDFVNYEGAEALLERDDWSREIFATGALPYFELLDEFLAAYDEFIASVDHGR